MKRLTTLIAGTALALSSAAPALAAAGAHPSQVTIGYSRSQGLLSGAVKSPEPHCLGHRDVSVYRKRSGQDQLVGSDATSHGGGWKLPVTTPKAGDYYAKAKSRVITGGRCAAAQSVTTHVS